MNAAKVKAGLNQANKNFVSSLATNRVQVIVAIGVLMLFGMNAASAQTGITSGADLLTQFCSTYGQWRLPIAAVLAVWKCGSAAVAYTTGQPGAVVQAGVGVLGSIAIMTGPSVVLTMMGYAPAPAGCAI